MFGGGLLVFNLPRSSIFCSAQPVTCSSAPSRRRGMIDCDTFPARVLQINRRYPEAANADKFSFRIHLNHVWAMWWGAKVEPVCGVSWGRCGQFNRRRFDLVRQRDTHSCLERGEVFCCATDNIIDNLLIKLLPFLASKISKLDSRLCYAIPSA